VHLLLTIILPLLLLSAIVSLLHYCYDLTGSASLSRLWHDEKNHEIEPIKKRLAPWVPRWSRLTVGYQAMSIVLQSLTFIGLGIVLTHARHSDAMNLAKLMGIGIGVLVVYGLLVRFIPRAIANAYADRVSLATLPINSLFYWPIALATLPAFAIRNGLSKIFPEHHTESRPSTEDEILSMVEHSKDEDLEEGEREMIKSALEFGDTVSREIMTPRVDLVGLEASLPIAEAAKIIGDANYSRFPVYQERIDEISGLVHVKDVLAVLTNGGKHKALADIANDIPFVPEQMPIDDLLKLMQSEKTQCAVVVDEYGGTAGLVSIEDIIEELVGEIVDKFDEEHPPIRALSECAWLVDARTPIDEVNEETGMHLPEKEEYDSLGGLVLHALGRIPAMGESLDLNGTRITIRKGTSRQLKSLEVAFRDPAATAGG